MRPLQLCGHWLVLGLVLGCSSAERDAPTRRGPAEAEVAVPKIEPPARRPSFDQRAPSVGDSAPPIALATLTGDQVALPMSGADRAAVLIFGSFS